MPKTHSPRKKVAADSPKKKKPKPEIEFGQTWPPSPVEDVDNPMSDPFDIEEGEEVDTFGAEEGEESKYEDGYAPDEDVADLDHDLMEDELSDLTYAFQAMDTDSSGTIEPEELHAMMSVLGADVDFGTILQLFRDTKEEFLRWLDSQKHRKHLPHFMKHDKNARHDTNEHGTTKHGGTRHHSELAIDRTAKHHPVFSRVGRAGKSPLVKYTVGAPLVAADTLLGISYALAKNAMPSGLMGGTAEEREREKAAMHELMINDTHMIFAEYTHMCTASDHLMAKYVPGDWHKRAGQMRHYRQAFDTADVDGGNSVEFEELEMVVIGMDPHHVLAHEDMLYMWDKMIHANNPAPDHDEQSKKAEQNNAESMNFLQFLHGMAAVRKDPKCDGWLDVDKPNKWELLSLIVDTPVSAVETKAILDR